MIEMDIIDVEARKLRSEGDADANYGITHPHPLEGDMSDLINLMQIYLPTAYRLMQCEVKTSPQPRPETGLKSK